jgi:hypothetical protein
LPLTVLSALLPILLPIHLLAEWMCRCLYRYRCLLVQEVLVYVLPVALLVEEEASSYQIQHHWPLAVLEALNVPAQAEEVEVLV